MNSLSKRDVLFILDKKLCLPVLLSSNLYFPINEKKIQLNCYFCKVPNSLESKSDANEEKLVLTLP